MIGLVINQLSQSSFDAGITIYISLNSINDSVVSNSTLNDIKTIPRLLSISTIYNEVKPFLIVSIKSFYLIVVLWQSKLISIHYCLFSSSNYLKGGFKNSDFNILKF